MMIKTEIKKKRKNLKKIKNNFLKKECNLNKVALFLFLFILNTGYTENRDRSDTIRDIMESGISNYRSKEYDKAILDFEKVIELDPENSKVYYNLGVTYYRDKNLKKAEDSFEKAISIDKSYLQAIYALAKVYEKQEKNEEAINLYKKVIKLNQTHPLAYDAKKNISKLDKKKDITDKIWYLSLGAKVGYDDNIVKQSSSKIPVKDVISILSLNASIEPILFDRTSLLIEFDHDSNIYGATPSFTYHSNTVTVNLYPRITDTVSFLAGFEYEIDDELAGVGYGSKLVSAGSSFSNLFIDSIKLKYEYQIEEFPFSPLYNAKSSNIILSFFNRFINTTNGGINYSYRINNADGNDFSYAWHRVMLRLKQRLSNDIWFKLGYQYRIKNYTNIDSTANLKRVDNRSVATAEFTYDITKVVTFLIGYTYINNTSNISIRSYTINMLFSGIELNL